MNNESNKLSIKKRLSKKEYELFMQNYQQMQNMIEQINNQPRGVF